ncbi:HalD/BesD family halogenase [Micromonospora chersina]|uniref:YxiG-like protein n=1 Tax=Micromonospora chersina TaxID=47854 RepID=UPI003CABBC87
MEIAELRRALDDVFDQAVVYHAYTNYMRDYEVIVYATADPRTGIQPAYLRYLFKYWVQVEASTALSLDTWRRSVDERLTDPEIGPDLDGYVWAVRWQALYPGAQLIAESRRAQEWAEQVGIDFHEVRIQMNGHNLNLIFSELEVSHLPSATRPTWSPRTGRAPVCSLRARSDGRRRSRRVNLARRPQRPKAGQGR